MPVEMDLEEWEERVEHLSILTKSAEYSTRERAVEALERLNAIAAAGLVKVGPKGYIHGWIYVGPQAVGSRVFHAEHGHGHVSRSGSRTVGVNFDNGHYGAFEHGHGDGAGTHFAARPGNATRPAAKPKATTGRKPPLAEVKPVAPQTTDHLAPSKGSVEDRVMAAYHDLSSRPGELVSLARIRSKVGSDISRADVDRTLKDLDRRRRLNLVPEPNRRAISPEGHAAAIRIGPENTHLAWSNEPRPAAASSVHPARPQVERATVDTHLSNAQAAISEGRHADAINHLTAAASSAPDRKSRDQITAMRAKLTARVTGAPDTGPKAPRKPRTPKVEPDKAVSVHDKLHQMINAETPEEAHRIAAGLKGKELHAAVAASPIAHHVGTRDTVGAKRTRLVNWATSADSRNSEAIRSQASGIRQPEAERAAIWESDREARRAELARTAPTSTPPVAPTAATPTTPARSTQEPRDLEAIARSLGDAHDQHVGSFIRGEQNRLNRGDEPAAVARRIRAQADHIEGRQVVAWDAPGTAEANRSDASLLRRLADRVEGEPKRTAEGQLITTTA